MTASLDELLDALAGPVPGPTDLAAVRRRHRRRQQRRRAARGLAAGAAVLALVVGLAVLARPDGYDVDTVDPAATSVTTTTATTTTDAPDQTRVAVSPLVDAASRLALADTRVRFRVTASEPSYWRTAGLHNYDGLTWRGRYDDGNTLPGTGENPAGGEVLRQTVTVESSDIIWLPAAPGVIDIVGGGLPIDWDQESGTLLSEPGTPGEPARSYLVGSTFVRPTPDQMQAAPDASPGEQYVSLPPEGLTAAVADEAERATAGATTRYGQALALQNHLRTLPYQAGNINVDAASIEAAVGGGEGGASPQLATAFVVMARHLGIPSRIAVGYTWGVPTGPEGDGTTYEVTDRQVHVWPEVWFAGIGWVAFEPTPGRGMPGAQAYTGVAAQQDADR